MPVFGRNGLAAVSCRHSVVDAQSQIGCIDQRAVKIEDHVAVCCHILYFSCNNGAKINILPIIVKLIRVGNFAALLNLSFIFVGLIQNT
jgi:hypothetical protein